jgi:hypothetical protein
MPGPYSCLTANYDSLPPDLRRIDEPGEPADSQKASCIRALTHDTSTSALIHNDKPTIPHNGISISCLPEHDKVLPQSAEPEMSVAILSLPDAHIESVQYSLCLNEETSITNSKVNIHTEKVLPKSAEPKKISTSLSSDASIESTMHPCRIDEPSIWTDAKKDKVLLQSAEPEMSSTSLFYE